MSKGLLVAIESGSVVIIGEGDYSDIFKLESAYSRLLENSGVSVRIIGEDAIHMNSSESVSQQLIEVVSKIDKFTGKEEVAGGKGTPTI